MKQNRYYLINKVGVYLIFGLLAFALSQCANPMAPDGGDQDEQPPRVVEEDSSPNYQTNFTKQPISIAFDEWVEINDPFNQIVISPPLEYRYELSIRKKSIIFEFDEREVLRDSATYTINFGEAIRDITERNPAEDLRYVFSTGPFIDSLSVGGKIVDAKTYKPVAEALFMLYENTADSVVRTERPFYFARTDESGKFLIQNVKSGTFKGFAIVDNNLNYLFDQAQEPIGFPDSLLLVQEGSEPQLTIRLFTEEQPIRLLDDNDDRYGLVKLTFSRPPKDVRFDYKDVGQRLLFYETQLDTTYVWYDLPAAAPWEIYVQKDTVLNDTIAVDAQERAAFVERANLNLLKGPPRSIKPTGAIPLTFNHPLAYSDTAQIRLYQDTSRTLVQANVRVDSSDGRRQLQVEYKWKEGIAYELQLLPGAVRDIYGLESDTIDLDFNAGLLKYYGNLLLTVDSLSADSAYVIELMDGDKVVKTYEVEQATQFTDELKVLEPASYSLRLTEDWNKDGRWTSGDYDRYRQPEPVYDHSFEQLRANWDLEAAIDLRTLQSKAAQTLQPPGLAPKRIAEPVDSLNMDSIRQRQQLPKSVRDRIDGKN